MVIMQVCTSRMRTIPTGAKRSKRSWESATSSDETKKAFLLRTQTQEGRHAWENNKNNYDEIGNNTDTHIIFDSCASQHVVNDERYMNDIEEEQPFTVDFANGKAVTTRRHGYVKIDMGTRKPSSCRGYIIPDI